LTSLPGGGTITSVRLAVIALLDRTELVSVLSPGKLIWNAYGAGNTVGVLFFDWNAKRAIF